VAYRIAITSSDGRIIDDHFGNATKYFIVEIDESGEWNFIDTRKIDKNKLDALSSEHGRKIVSCGHDQIFLSYVFELIRDCQFLLTKKIGAIPSSFLSKNQINALEAPGDIDLAVRKLHQYRKKKL
jgi:hypothetical protein